MSEQSYIRSMHDNVSIYTRNFNDILSAELLYEGDSPVDADPADYIDAASVKAASLSGVRVG